MRLREIRFMWAGGKSVAQVDGGRCMDRWMLVPVCIVYLCFGYVRMNVCMMLCVFILICLCVCICPYMYESEHMCVLLCIW